MILHLKPEVVSMLKKEIIDNKEKYQEDICWLLEEYKEWIKESDLKVEPLIYEGDGNLDLENTKLFFSKYKDLSLVDANQESTWVYLTHLLYWDYMKHRWIKNKDIITDNFIKDHYFKGQHPRSRNGLARLWWCGYLTYDENLDNPWEYTELMMNYPDSDLQRLIIESPLLATNPTAIRVLIQKVYSLREEGEKFNIRNLVRHFIKRYNLLGGVKVWNSLSEESMKANLERIIEEYIKEQSKDLVLQ